jgi:ferritin-like metal-binding protein YciE
MTIASSMDVFFDQLKDLRSATAQTHRTLPDLVRRAHHGELRDQLAGYATAVHAHLRQILLIFEGHSIEPADDLCKAMAGLIEGGNAHLDMAADAVVRDHLLIAHCHRIGHYLLGAAAFTLGIARKCGLVAEADALAEMAARHRDFTEDLAGIGTTAFGLEMKECP